MHFSCTKTRKTSPAEEDSEPVSRTPAIAAHVHWATTETQSAFQPRPNWTFAARRPAIFVRVFNVVSHHTAIKLEFDSKVKTAGGWIQMRTCCLTVWLVWSDKESSPNCSYLPILRPHKKRREDFKLWKSIRIQHFQETISTKWKLLFCSN